MNRRCTIALCLVALLLCSAPAMTDDQSEETNVSVATPGVAQAVAVYPQTSASGTAVSGRVLAVTDLEETVAAELALELLGVEYEIYRDDGEFSAALAEGNWDLVIADLPLKQHDCSPMTTWVEDGGKLIASMWRPCADLLGVMEAEAVGEGLSTALPIYSWDSSGALFVGVEEIPLALQISEERWLSNGFRLEPQGTARALAGFSASQQEDQAAVVLGNAGRTLMNGFLFSDYIGTDSDGDGADDIVELLANEAAYLLGAGAPSDAWVERRMEPGVAVEATIAARGVEWVDGTISGYLQYTIDIPVAWAVAFHVCSGGDVDLYVSAGKPLRIEKTPDGDQITGYTFAAVSSHGEESLVIADPQEGTRYWIAVENKEDGPADYSLEVRVAPVVEELPMGSAMGSVSLADAPTFAYSTLSTGQGTLSLRQYRFTVSSSESALSIRVEGSGSWQAHLRKDFPVEGSSEGAVSDLSFRFAGLGEFALGGILTPGTYYLALEALSPPQLYTLTATRQ